MEQKKCVNCGELKYIDQFHRTKETISGRRGTCNVCCRASQRRTLTKQESFLKLLCRSAKKNSKRRGHKFELEFKDIQTLWEWQEGCCYYSNIPMKTIAHSDWQCSLERLNTKQGYHLENVVLCCGEFNGQVNWTLEKISEFKNLCTMLHNKSNELDDLATEQVNPPRLPIREKTIDGKIHWSCNLCGIFKPENQYYKMRRVGCKSCTYEASKRLLRQPRGHLQKLIRSAKRSTKDFEKNKKRIGDYSMDVDYDFLVELWERQNGLCQLSGIPLNVGPYEEKNWTASLERRDANKGYQRDNVALICVEFNTAIRSSMSEAENVTGDGGWTHTKLEYWQSFW